MAIDKSRLFEAQNGISVLGSGSEAEAGFVRVGRGYLPFNPAHIQSVTYLSSGDVDYLDFYRDSVATANRYLRITVGYTSGEPSSEVHRLYGEDGVTLLETRTYTFTKSADLITQVSEVIT